MSGDQWHLRKTNWCGEAAEILDDEVTRLEMSYLQINELTSTLPKQSSFGKNKIVTQLSTHHIWCFTF